MEKAPAATESRPSRVWWWFVLAGILHLAAWTHQLGWHMDWSGRPDPEDMTGWTYVAPV